MTLTLTEIFGAAGAIANVGLSAAMPFIIWMLAEMRRDIREIKTVNITQLYGEINALRDRMRVVELSGARRETP